jgi:hypothetical protein
MSLIPSSEPAPRRRKQPAIDFNPIDQMLRGTYMELSIKDLTVPWDDYQRDREASNRALEIAIAWNWIACGTLIVILRPDGSHVIADGGTRLAAAKTRGDIRLMPCMVYEVNDAKQEAEAFRLINQHRDKLRVHELHKSELFEGRDNALEAQDYLDRLLAAGVQFDSLAEIRRKLAKRQRTATLRLFPVFVELGSGRHLSARVFKGLVMVEIMLTKKEETLSSKRYIVRLKRHGLLALEAAISALLPTRGSSGTAKIYAQAIINLLKIKGLE